MLNDVAESELFVDQSRLLRIRAREKKHRLDEIRQVRGFGADHFQRAAVIIDASLARQRHFRFAPDDGHRRAQFVRCVGEKLFLLLE